MLVYIFGTTTALLTAVATFLTMRHSLAVQEYNIARATLERLREENRVLLTENAQLKSRPDIAPLAKAFDDLSKSFMIWQTEARANFINAMSRLEDVRAENLKSFSRLLERIERLEK